MQERVMMIRANFMRQRGLSCIRGIAFALFLTTAAVAAPLKPVEVKGLEGKVSVKLGQSVGLQFDANGDRLQNPRTVKGTGGGEAKVQIRLETTDSTPFPVRGVATRPFLVVSNGFDRPMNFRVLAREKGSREFFEVDWAGGPVDPGEQSPRCWESGSRVEELVLYQFALEPKRVR
jgi:hypothetical protein